MGHRILRIAPQLLADFLVRGTGMVEVIANPLPDDAAIVDVRMDAHGHVILLWIASRSYPEPNPGDALAEVLPPMFARR